MKLPMLTTSDKLAEIRRLYFTTTRETIERDLTKALDLLRSLVAGVATWALLVACGPLPPYVAIPCTIALYLVLSLGTGLVKIADADHLKAIIARKRRAPMQPSPSLAQ